MVQSNSVHVLHIEHDCQLNPLSCTPETKIDCLISTSLSAWVLHHMYCITLSLDDTGVAPHDKLTPSKQAFGRFMSICFVEVSSCFGKSQVQSTMNERKYFDCSLNSGSSSSSRCSAQPLCHVAASQKAIGQWVEAHQLGVLCTLAWEAFTANHLTTITKGTCM